MKKILITGKTSYIGGNLMRKLKNDVEKYDVESISVKDKAWEQKDFTEYDVVVHVAGIAHIKETKENAKLFYEVNRDLAYEIALKAKDAGIKHFIFLSTMSVYGIEEGIISKNSPQLPKSNYGKSKLQAEHLLSSLETNSFKLAIIRPPMVYGENCKGNYAKLTKLARYVRIFPIIKNERSMISIHNLCEFIKLLIDNEDRGLFFPQNREFVQTTNMVKLIAESYEKKTYGIGVFSPIIYFFIGKHSLITKIFGNLVYEKSMSVYKDDYCVVEFSKSIKCHGVNLK